MLTIDQLAVLVLLLAVAFVVTIIVTSYAVVRLTHQAKALQADLVALRTARKGA